MKNILNKKLNKKGFTLAELLIVVAIIAILVAIALPLFFGALDDAKRATFDADLRSLKAAGVAYLLQHPDAIESGKDYQIEGSIDGAGNITGVTVTAVTKGSATTSTYDKYTAPKGENKVTLQVAATETDVSAPGAGG